MKFATARSPTSPVSPTIFLLSWILAVILIALATAQLMFFEKYVSFVQNLDIFHGSSFGHVFAALLVIFEVMALPFLLRMRLSRLFRAASASCVALAVFAWVFLGFSSIINI